VERSLLEVLLQELLVRLEETEKPRLFQVLALPTRVAVEEEALQVQEVLAALEEEEMEGVEPAIQVLLLEQRTQAVAVAVAVILLLVLLEVQALSLCLTRLPKAQRLNFCLRLIGLPQLAFQPLITL
jgi:hypothetical protein